MNNPIIEVSGLSKQYRIGTRAPYKTLRESIMNVFSRNSSPFTIHHSQSSDTFWALKDVSFDVQQGEVVGIIGRNGAGKSTLLKILSRITEPTEGEIRIRGRVASLLEVGTGFHPELTGRENIFLNGAILGMSKAEINRKFDEIVAFAEIEKFIDTPVKRYSSGMYVRLAFAVAAHLEPEILIVDEVLAVGDAAFQKKCLGKMGEVAKGGRTVLFVSHNMGAITSLCKEAIQLDRGRIVASGDVGKVTNIYISSSNIMLDMAKSGINFEADEKKAAQILSICLIKSSGEQSLVHEILKPIRIEIEYQLRRDFQNLYVGFQLKTAEGQLILTTTDMDFPNFGNRELRDVFPKKAGRYRTTVELPHPLLNTGIYEVVVGAVSPKVEVFDLKGGIYFEVIEAAGGSFASYPFKERRLGLLAIPLPWEISQES